MKAKLLTLVFAFVFVITNAQTYTTVQDGDWSSNSTWDANGKPPIDLSNDVVNINHRVELSNTIKLQGNSTLNVNFILKLITGSIEIENSSDTVNIDHGLIIVINGNVANKEGTVNFNYGRMQLCNDGYKDESSSPQGTFGIGSIFSQNGNIEDSNSGNYSSYVEWCCANGDGVNLPNSEDCPLLNPPSSYCEDEFTYLTLFCALGLDSDNDGVANTCDLDDDNDGITDVVEQNGNPTRDSDGDGLIESIDIDSDNDGIPDNIEAQLTIGYIAPTGEIDIITGILTVYGSGLAPIDTDGDGVSDIIDSDTDGDGLPDIQENGMTNSILNADTDSDGLDNAFEGANLNDPYDSNDEINNPSISILPDTDGDLYTGGDLDYRDLFNTNPPISALLDFDGVDDYLSTPTFIDGLDEVTIMAWVKPDTGNSGYTTIAGEDVSCKLYLKNGNEPCFSIRTNGNTTKVVSANAINKNEWHHISGTYSNATGKLIIFVDGKQENFLDTGATTDKIEVSSDSNGAFEVGRNSSNVPDREYLLEP